MDYVAGVDLGATNLRVAIANADGELLGRTSRKTPHTSGESVVTGIRDALEGLLLETGLDSGEIAGVGIGSVGPLDRQAGEVKNPPNLPDVDRIPVRGAVASVVDAPVVLRNDATAGAIGLTFHTADAPSNLAYVTLSSGVGAGVLVDDRPIIGATGNAAEVGHFPLDPDAGMQCGCGGVGHWEAFCGGENLPHYARHIARTEEIETRLNLAELTARDLFQAAPGDPLADTVLTRFGEWNTQGVVLLVHAFDPELVVFGGGVSINNPTAVLEPIRNKLESRLFRDPPTIELTALGTETVLRGAVAVAVTAASGGDS